MKHLVYPIFSLLLLCIATAGTAAQSNAYKGRMSIVPLQLDQVGDSLFVAIDFDVKEVTVNTYRSISLVPVLIAPTQQKRLPEVMVKGRSNFLSWRRELTLMNKFERSIYEISRPYAIVKGYKSKEPKNVSYRMTIAFEPWMREAHLEIQEDQCGCGNAPRLLSVTTLVNQVKTRPIVPLYNIAPQLSYLQPEIVTIQKQEMSGEAFLDFVVSKIDIRPNYMNNPVELKRITDMMEEVHRDTAIKVIGISVVGYASPEGTHRFNQTLSRGRANALINYLYPRFNYPKSMYRVEYGGENWSGLRQRIQNSQMQYKKEVLSILDDTRIDSEQRKTKLKELHDNLPYRYMLKHDYPTLRKAICKIVYHIEGYNAAKTIEVYDSRPNELSLEEFYLVANTYTKGSKPFIKLFRKAVELFPNDIPANLNTATAALDRKDTTAAESYLKKIERKCSAPEYFNTLGVLLLYKGEYNGARQALEKAAKSGLNAAKHNLDELTKKLESIDLRKE